MAIWMEIILLFYLLILGFSQLYVNYVAIFFSMTSITSITVTFSDAPFSFTPVVSMMMTKKVPVDFPHP